MSALRFGFCAPIFAAPGNLNFRTPNCPELDAVAVRSLARRADALGYDSLWVADHLMLGKDEAILEGWTTLSVLAGATQHIRLGMIHQSNVLRHPPLAAKMAATLDQLSAGRLIHFFDLGNNAREHRAYGFDWIEEDVRRVEMMEEALEYIVALWTAEGPISLRGDYYSVEEAVCRPQPLQQPHPPIWVGECKAGLLDLCARRAQGWNSVPVGRRVLAERLGELEAACRRNGRDMDELECSYETQILVASDRTQLRSKVKRMLALSENSPDPQLADFVEGRIPTLPVGLTERFLIGTPDEVVKQIEAYAEIGIDHFMLWFMDAPEGDGLELFAEEVMPSFRT